MAMVDMKRSKAEKKSTDTPMKSPGDDYGYGLEVRLEHEHLKKLGITKLPQVGQKMNLAAHAHVTNVSEHHGEGDSTPRRHVTLQLRKMELGTGAQSTDAPDEEQAEESKKGARAAMDSALSKAAGSESGKAKPAGGKKGQQGG